MPHPKDEDPTPTQRPRYWGDSLINLQEEFANLDRLDGKIAKLLFERAETALRIQMKYAADGLPLTARAYDAHVIARFERLTPGSGPVARAIIKHCRNLEEAFQRNADRALA